MKLDRVIIATDDSHFKDFAEIVYTAWKKLFPQLKITLAYVSKSLEDLERFKTIFDDVLLFPEIDRIPTANLAKIARRYACTLYDNEICMIEDIDTAPLNKEYINNIVIQRKKDTLGLIGYEVYQNTPHRGKVPSSYTFTESYIWKKALNPQELDFESWAKSFINMSLFDEKEDVSNYYPKEFSDESLMRAILQLNNFSDITLIPRNCNPYKDWIDRSWWSIDKDRLANGEYISVNFMRPLNVDLAKPVIDYIYCEQK